MLLLIIQIHVLILFRLHGYEISYDLVIRMRKLCKKGMKSRENKRGEFSGKNIVNKAWRRTTIRGTL